MVNAIYFISGLFCMHLVNAFTQLHVRKIPNVYGKHEMPDLLLSRAEMMW
jgi:hypothetical protein